MNRTALRRAALVAGRDDLVVAYCSTVKLHWLQPKGELRNAYGVAAPECGRVVKP